MAHFHAHSVASVEQVPASFVATISAIEAQAQQLGVSLPRALKKARTHEEEKTSSAQKGKSKRVRR
jgi:hypothetical protein